MIKKQQQEVHTIEINHGLLKNHHTFFKKNIYLYRCIVKEERGKGKGTYTIAFIYIIGKIENCITRK